MTRDEMESKIKSMIADNPELAAMMGDKKMGDMSDEEVKAMLEKMSEKKNMQADTIFTELSIASVSANAPFDGLPSTEDLGYSLTDMHGSKVEIKKSDLPAFMENTLAAIESTRTASGEVVGLPIDLNNHDHEGGAGWIVGIEHDTARNILKFVPRWTQAGIDLIKNDIRRFFSASFNLVNKVIEGGSLTNRPATKNRKGQYLLRPLELSEQLYVLPEEVNMENSFLRNGLQEIADKFTSLIAGFGKEKPKGEKEMALETPIAAPPVLPPEIPNPTLIELLKTPEAVQELGKMAEARAQEFVKAEMRKKEIVEFASTLVGGSKDSPYGLPVKASDVVALLLSLPPQQAMAVQMLLTKTMQATVNFMESGLSGEFNAHPRLPEAFRPHLQSWIDAGKDIKAFFAVNVELGSAEDYNLTEFAKEK